MGQSVFPAPAAGGSAVDNWVLISTTTVATNTTSLNIPYSGGYKKLLFDAYTFSDYNGSAQTDVAVIIFNSRVTNEYYLGFSEGLTEHIKIVNNGGNTGFISGVVTIDSPDSTGPKRIMVGSTTGGGSGGKESYFNDTTAITDIKIKTSGGNQLKVGSRIRLYGVTA